MFAGAEARPDFPQPKEQQFAQQSVPWLERKEQAE